MGYHLDFTDKAKEDIAHHQKTGNRAVLNKLFTLLEEMEKNPFSGTGKPELLKYKLSGMWSRRINREHRLIYEVNEDIIYILSAKGHYEE